MGTFEGYGAAANVTSPTPYVVTTLADDASTPPSGSLREAVEASGARKITFAVEGWIFLEESLVIANDNCEIDGSTAPGNGIVIAANPTTFVTPWKTLQITASNVILQYLRICQHVLDTANSAGDALSLNGADTVMIDQCSFWGAIDEVVDFTDSTNITIQWSIIALGLRDANHTGGLHGLGLLATGSSGGDISIHHNLFPHNAVRNPRNACTGGPVEVINNVIYNPDLAPADTGAGSSTDFVKNYYIRGADSSNHWLINADNSSTIYHNSSNECANCTGFTDVDPGDSPTISGTPLASPTTPVTEETPTDAYDSVLAGAGATLPERHTVDLQMIDQTTLGAGSIINALTEIGGVMAELPSFS